MSGATVPLGSNLGALTYYSNALPFVDLMKNAEGFMSANVASTPGPWDTNVVGQIPHDPEGYPLEIPYTVSSLSTPQTVRIPTGRSLYAGDYVLLFDGDGDFQFLGQNIQVTSTALGRIVLHVSAGSPNTIFVTITRSNKADHVRNVRLIMPGFESTYATNPFHPTYLANLHGVSELRFMDWGRTNDSPVTQWSQRTLPGDFQGGARGVALEYMVDLANQAGTDAWFSVPHLADDNYVTQMATLIRDRLAPGRIAHIEYSNELWNTIFSQTAWSMNQGCSVGLNNYGPYSGLCTDSGVKFWAGVKWNARRSAQIFSIFSQVFGGTQRLRHVLGSQSSNPSLGDTLLTAFADSQVNPLARQPGAGVDELAVAPYFGHGIADTIVANGQVNSITVDAIIALLQARIDTDVKQPTIQNKTVAGKWGVQLVAYEGGQHLVAGIANQNDATLTQKLIDTNRDPRMYGLYQSMFAAWYQGSGNGLFTAFTYIDEYSKFGSWGMLEDQSQSIASAPKYRAFRDQLTAFGAP